VKKFKFNLQPVMRLREQDEKLKQKKVAEAMQRLNHCRGRIEGSYKIMNEAFDSMREVGCGELDMGQIITHRRLLNYLDVQVASLSAEHVELAKKAEALRGELVEAARKRKSLENLRQKRLSDYYYDAACEERKYFDEIGSSRTVLTLRKETVRKSRLEAEGRA